MIISGTGKRYAVALFNAAEKADVAEQVDGDITSFARLFADNAGMRNFLMSPQVLTEDKKELLMAVLGERASGLFVKFVMLLLDKKRMGSIEEIAKSYTKLYEASRGIMEVTCVTAIPLGPELELKTRQTIEAKTGKQVRLTARTNPDIIGGMVLLAEDKIIDGSIRHQLNTMRKQLNALKVH